MRSSHETPASQTFQDRELTLPRIQPTPPTPRRKSVRQGVLEPKSQTLEHGVLALFPFAEKPRLQAWRESLERAPQVEVEPLLFLAAVCGARFQLVRLDPGEIGLELSDWLRSHPRRMRGELVAVLIEALRPAIERVADQQGWRRGLDWQPVAVRGRPEETRGVWAAAVLVDAQLVHLGQDPPRAVEHAQSLASALLTRDTQPHEFYERRTAMSGPQTAALRSKILDAYEQMLEIEARGHRDPNPGPKSLEFPAWRARHRGLHFLLAREGCEETARQIASSIPEPLWAPMEPTPAPPGAAGDDRISDADDRAIP